MADAITWEEVKALKDELAPEYMKRHTAFRNLRRYWQGDYWKLSDTDTLPIATVFRDLTARTSDIGPDIKLVHNVLQVVCVKLQTFLSQLPQIRVYVDPPESDLRRAQATLKERYLYGCWSEGNMTKILNKAAWYLPLMGDTYLGIWPNFERNLPWPVLRSPEFAYPVPSFDGYEENATIFAWKMRESTALRHFPAYVPPDERYKSTKRLGRLRAKSQPDDVGSVELLEYSDGNQWQRWVDGQPMNGVMHNFGWNLFEHVKYIDVPGEPFGHSAVEQIVNLNEMGNALYSLMFQAVIENVFPRMVLIDPAKAPEEIDVGPGAVIPINPGGAVEWLHPPVQALGMQSEFLGLNTHNIKEASGMSEAEFGQSPATSIVTGKAVDALQAAGSGNVVEMVQGSALGPGLVSWNEKCLKMGQTVFRNERMRLYGRTSPGTMEMNGSQVALSLKGSELIGSTRNEVVFQVMLGQHEKLVMNLQALGGGLVSKKFAREQFGINDNTAMIEEILTENVEDAVLGFFTAALQQAATPQAAEQVEQDAATYLAGGTPVPHPLLNAPAPMAGAPGAGAAQPPSLPAQGPPGLPGLPGGTGFPQAAAAPAPQGGAQPAGGQVSLNDVVAALIPAVASLQGRVFLVGDIVIDGQAQQIEVSVTARADQEPVAQALSQWRTRLVFHVVPGEPREPYVEVTPKGPVPGGPSPAAGGPAAPPPAPAGP